MKKDNSSSITFYRNVLAECCSKKDYLRAILVSEKIISIYNSEAKNERYVEDIYNIACIYMIVKKFKEAGELLEDIRKNIKDERISDRILINILNSKAVCCARTSKFTDAENYLQQAFGVLERNKRLEKNPYVVKYNVLIHNMGSVKLDLKKFDEAIALLKEETNIVQKKTFEYSDALILIAAAYEGKNNYAESINYVNEAIKTTKKIAGINSKEYMELVYYLAGLYYKNADYNNAFVYYEKAGELVKKFLNERHPFYAEVMNKLSNVYVGLNNMERAIFLRQKAMNIIKNAFGDLHIYYIYCLEKLALTYKIKGDYKSAADTIGKVLEIKEKLNGKKSEAYVKSLLILYNLYMESRDYEGAVEVLKTASVLSEKFAEIGMEVRFSKAEVYIAAGHIKKAAQLIRLFCRGKNGLTPAHFINYLEKSDYVSQNDITAIYNAFEVPYEKRKEKTYSNVHEISNEIVGMFEGKPVNTSSRTDKILGSIIDIVTAARKNNVDLTGVEDFMGAVERITDSLDEDNIESELPSFIDNSENIDYDDLADDFEDFEFIDEDDDFEEDDDDFDGFDDEIPY